MVQEWSRPSEWSRAALSDALRPWPWLPLCCHVRNVTAISGTYQLSCQERDCHIGNITAVMTGTRLPYREHNSCHVRNGTRLPLLGVFAAAVWCVSARPPPPSYTCLWIMVSGVSVGYVNCNLSNVRCSLYVCALACSSRRLRLIEVNSRLLSTGVLAGCVLWPPPAHE